MGYDGESENCRHWDKSKGKVHISSDVEFYENSLDFEQNTKNDDFCKIEIDFGDLDSAKNVDEAHQWLEQQPIVENEPTSTWQQRDRSAINLLDRYEVPVALIADIYEVTYEEVMVLLA